MDVNSIFSATRWGSVGAASSSSKIVFEKQDSTEAAAPSGKASSDKDGKVTTKITVNEKGERIMVFMEGDKVIRTIKLGNNGQMPESKEMSDEEEEYVDNGTSDVGLMLNVST